MRHYVLPLLVIAGLMFGCVYTVESTYRYMDEYAEEHDCRWDYNDMCYTREQRPWLFKD